MGKLSATPKKETQRKYRYRRMADFEEDIPLRSMLPSTTLDTKSSVSFHAYLYLQWLMIGGVVMEDKHDKDFPDPPCMAELLNNLRQHGSSPKHLFNKRVFQLPTVQREPVGAAQAEETKHPKTRANLQESGAPSSQPVRNPTWKPVILRSSRLKSHLEGKSTRGRPVIHPRARAMKLHQGATSSRQTHGEGDKYLDLSPYNTEDCSPYHSKDQSSYHLQDSSSSYHLQEQLSYRPKDCSSYHPQDYSMDPELDQLQKHSSSSCSSSGLRLSVHGSLSSQTQGADTRKIVGTIGKIERDSTESQEVLVVRSTVPEVGKLLVGKEDKSEQTASWAKFTSLHKMFLTNTLVNSQTPNKASSSGPSGSGICTGDPMWCQSMPISPPIKKWCGRIASCLTKEPGVPFKCNKKDSRVVNCPAEDPGTGIHYSFNEEDIMLNESASPLYKLLTSDLFHSPIKEVFPSLINRVDSPVDMGLTGFSFQGLISPWNTKSFIPWSPSHIFLRARENICGTPVKIYCARLSPHRLQSTKRVNL